MFSSGVNLGGGGRAGSGGGGAATSVDYQDYDASGGLYPTTYAGGAIAKGNAFRVTVASPVDGSQNIKFPVGAILIALVAAPGQVDANWRNL